MVFGCNSEENARTSERGCCGRMEYCQIIVSSGPLGGQICGRHTVLYPALTTNFDLTTKLNTLPFPNRIASSVFSTTKLKASKALTWDKADQVPSHCAADKKEWSDTSTPTPAFMVRFMPRLLDPQENSHW